MAQDVVGVVSVATDVPGAVEANVRQVRRVLWFVGLAQKKSVFGLNLRKEMDLQQLELEDAGVI